MNELNMYQAWPWSGTASASPNPGLQPTASAQWPAGYGQYAVSPEMQQQWAAAWASQAQYAYGTNVPTADGQTNAAFAGVYSNYQTPVVTSSETKNTSDTKNDSNTTTERSRAVEQNIPQESLESDKIKQLKEQAEKWTSQQQTSNSSWSYSTAATNATSVANMTTVTAPAGTLASTIVTQSGASQLTQMSKEEEEFERQFKDWEKQFEAWKQQNMNHPDKEAFAQYEKQWQEWREQLLQKKEQMQRAKAEQMSAHGSLSMPVQSTTVPNAAGTMPNSTMSSTANPGLYYQHPQYMYMQQYMYPGATAVAPAVMPPAVVPSAGVPPASMPPVGMPPTGVHQIPYNAPPDSYGNPSLHGMPGDGMPPHGNMHYDNQRPQDYDDRNMYNYGPGQRNDPRDDGMGPNYEFESPNMNLGEEEDYRRSWNRGRGRGGRGRARGRGRDRWSDSTDMDMRHGSSGGLRNQRKTLLPGGPPGGPSGFPDDGPPPFEYPTEDCRDQFIQDERHFSEEMQGPLPNPGDDGYYPDDAPFHEKFVQEFPERFPPGGKRFSSDQDRFQCSDGYPPERFPSDRERFPNEGMFPPGQERFPPKGGRFPPEDDRYPPEEDHFPPKDGRFPLEDDRFLPDDHRFPPGRFMHRQMMDDGRFGDEFDQFPPPDDEMFGPPFGDDFPPFDDRGPRGRGRFRGRGGRFQRDFDRFGPPPFPPRMDEPFGPPDFPPDDRFGFPGEGPPRMPPQRGMRPPFDPAFGPGRFPEDQFFGDGHPRFKSIDYTHRSASAVMGDDFNPHYDYEGEFQDDVNAYRDNFNEGVYLAPCDAPIIFSQVNVESFDYGHGMKPMTSTTIEGKENFKDNEPASLGKGFDYSYDRDRSPAFHERNFTQDRNFHDRESYRDLRSKDRDRSRDRNRENDKDRDKDRKENIRDNRDRDRDNYDRDSRDRGRERDLKRDRDWDRDSKRDDDEKRYKWSKNRENDRDFSKDKSQTSSNSKKEIDAKNVEVPRPFKPDLFKNDTSSETVLIEDILVEPKRSTRPKQLVIILRGLPGSGKTYFAKLIKDKEIENGGSAPRILSLDDYFMVETEVTEPDPDTGKKINRKEFKFEYEFEMEEAYRSSLLKSFKKTIDDRFFPFIIVDAVNEKSKQYEQFWSYAKQKGFQVYIAEMDCKDPVICHKRNIHNRTFEDINKILKQWEPKPRHFISMDVRSLLQDIAITEVEMEDETDKLSDRNENILPDEDSEESNLFLGHEPSKWEKLEATEEKLDQLDGLRVSKKKHSSMEDYLQLPDDYDERKCEPGKKRVRWADLEQRKEQDRLRAIGFVVGQTDWTKLTDPTQADKALTKTKYF